LPQTFSEDLSVSLTYEDKLSETSYIAVGMETWVPSLNDDEIVYQFFPATSEDGVLTSVIPANAVSVARTFCKVQITQLI
jgi:hypothetical protein